MKILYIGHYTEFSGWAKASIDNILALDAIGVDVVCRPVRLTNAQNHNLPEKIQELELKDTENVTHCIQHVLPHHLCGTQTFIKNVAYFEDEGIHTKKNLWHNYLNLVDEIFVPNHQSKHNLQEFVSKKISVVPHAIDINKIKENINKPIQSISLSKYQNAYKFYSILDLNDRKNLDDIIICFLTEFTKKDNVVLLLKIKKFGIEGNKLSELVGKTINEYINSLRLHNEVFNFPDIAIISENLDDQQIAELHKSSNCYVHPSHAEAWSIPAFEAMAYGNTPICSKEGGPLEYIDEQNPNTGMLIDGQWNTSVCRDVAFPFLFTGNDLWFNPSHIKIKQSMRYYYENKKTINKEEGLIQASKFDYHIIGQHIKELLNEPNK